VRVSDDTAAKKLWSPSSPGSTPHRPPPPPPPPMVPLRVGSPPALPPLPPPPAPVDTTPFPCDTNRVESTINLGLWHISCNRKSLVAINGYNILYYNIILYYAVRERAWSRATTGKARDSITTFKNTTYVVFKI